MSKKQERWHLPCDVSVDKVVGHRRPSGDELGVGWALQTSIEPLLVEYVLQSLGQSWMRTYDGGAVLRKGGI